MAYVLQVEFSFQGPFGDEMAAEAVFADLAKSITEEEGFIWKIWTESVERNEAGGIYLFETRESAEKYKDLHTKRMAGFGINDASMKVFEINEKMTHITKGPIK